MSAYNRVRYQDRCDISRLLGKTLTAVEGLEGGSTEVVFTTEDGERYLMYHESDCCEFVSIDDVCGHVEQLVGLPIVLAEEVSNSNEDPEYTAGTDVDLSDGYRESWTWTFYRIGTQRGTVTIRWFGESNGYYSEGVDFGPVEQESGS